MAWGKQDSTTLGSAGSDLDITSMTASKLNQFMIHSITVGGENKHNFRFDDNSNTDYARRRSNDGASDSTDTSQSQIEYYGGVANDRFEVFYSCNVSGQEKLGIHFLVTQNATGAGSAPARAEAVSKCDTTTNSGQYTRIDCFEDVSGQYDTGSNISGLGSDITPSSLAVVDGTVFYDTDLNKEYVLYNGAWTEL
jgi:hypothetical protein